jgi:hypothetical protein
MVATDTKTDGMWIYSEGKNGALIMTIGEDNGRGFSCECSRLRDAKDDNLTIATLCDLVLGEAAEDRSNTTLVLAVGALVRKESR